MNSRADPDARSDLADEPDIEFYGASISERHGWRMALIEYGDGRRDLLALRFHLAHARLYTFEARTLSG